MQIISLVFLLFHISLSNLAAEDLKCSANGLNVLYVNGVWVNKVDNENSVDLLRKKLASSETRPYVLDKKELVGVTGIWNTSRGLLNDIEEIKAQLAANHNGEKRIEYWRKLAEYKIYPQVGIPGDFASEAQIAAEKKKIDDALVQITSKPKFTSDDDGIIDQNAYTQSDLYKDLIKYNSSLASLLATATSDIAVVQQLKIKIKEAYNGGANKLIVVAHSQGNEVLYSAIQDLRNDRSFLTSQEDVIKFDGLIGYMQVAPPSPKLVTSPVAIEDVNNHSQYIRHNRDGIIGLSNAMTGFKPVDANYTSEVGIPPEGFPTFASAVGNFLDNLFNTYLNKGIFTLYHGMDAVYLSDSYKSTRNSNGSNKALVEHFKENMREIANKLEDNCKPVFELNVSKVMSNKVSASLSIKEHSTAFIEDVEVEWSFGDGTSETVNSLDTQSHTYATYGNLIVTALIKAKIFGQEENYSLSKTIDISPPVSVVLLSSSYTFETFCRRENGVVLACPGLHHTRTASIRAEGPVGTSINLGNSQIHTLSCGSWSVSNNHSCIRGVNDPYQTTISSYNKDQCGGEGCVPLPMGQISIPYNQSDLSNSPITYYEGPDVPQP